MTRSVPARVRRGRQPLAQAGRHQVAGRVVEVRDQVGQPGRRGAQRREQQVGVPAVGGSRS